MRSGGAGYSRPVTKLAAVVGTSHGVCKRNVSPEPGWTTRLGDAESIERHAIVTREALEQLNNFYIGSSTTSNNDIGSAHHGDDTPASHHVNLLGEPVFPYEEVVAAFLSAIVSSNPCDDDWPRLLCAAGGSALYTTATAAIRACKC
jgi:hypothetical protein